jgi:hypothetical protein
MKKSQLRKLIKELIVKEKALSLIHEQGGGQIPNSKRVRSVSCWGGPGQMFIASLTINGQAPQVGQIFRSDHCAGSGPVTRIVTAILGPGDRFAYPNVGNNGHIYGTGAQQTFDPNNMQPGAFCPSCIGPNHPDSNQPGYLITPPGAGNCTDVPHDASILANACTPVPPPPPPPVSCDNTMNGSCAQQWLPSNLAASWQNMTNFACTGGNTYDALISNNMNQVVQVFVQQNLTNFISQFSSVNNYSDISNLVNSTGLQQPQKGQIKRKLAKAFWANCMKTECQC